MTVSLAELKKKDAVKQDSSYAAFGIPAPIGSLMDLLHVNEQKRSGFVSKQRILKNRAG